MQGFGLGSKKAKFLGVHIEFLICPFLARGNHVRYAASWRHFLRPFIIFREIFAYHGTPITMDGIFAEFIVNGLVTALC